MNGICGLIYKDENSTIPKDTLLRMGKSLSISDTQLQVQVNKNIGLVSGTSIVVNRSLRIVCDAELYNIREIVNSLEQKGYCFNSINEAEVILFLYQEYGEACLDQMRGQFSFAIWDGRDASLFMATDRFAIRPLYYYYHDSYQFIFGSKIRAIMASHEVPREINYSAIFQYLYYTIVPTPYSIFKDVYKLPPGHSLRLKGGIIEIRKYWDMTYHESDERNEAFYTKQVKEQIREAVAVHLTDDCTPLGNVGSFLSGGTDSSTVVGMLSMITGNPVKTFSIGFEEEAYNEIEYARITARYFKAEHFEYFVSPLDTLNAIPILIKEYDEPFGNSSAIASYYCAKLAKDNNVNTLFAGDGGDELFAGNERYLWEKILSIYQGVPQWMRKQLIEPLMFNFDLDNVFLMRKAKRYIRRSNIPNPKRFFSYHFLEEEWRHLEGILTKEFLEAIQLDLPLRIAEEYYTCLSTISDLNRLLYLDLKLTITDNDLRKITGTAGTAGVKVRFPLLDHKLAEFSGTIPSSLKLKGFKKRYIFKKALQNFLPRDTIKKKKRGFGVPVARWLATDKALRSLAEDALLGDQGIRRGYFKNDYMEDLFGRLENDDSGYYGNILWLFLMLELWHREYIDR